MGPYIGDHIGRYRLLEIIGESDFATVYVAEQAEPYFLKVALKVARPNKADLARFEAERQTLAMMDHPNIPKILGDGVTEAGWPYLVMEYVAGEPITDYCDRLNLCIRERLALFIQVCKAIEHAHNKLIIHRDIKPDNILVTVSRDDRVAVRKVIDFGIAKSLPGQRLTRQQRHTIKGHFIGTPPYMAPEQTRSSDSPIDTSADVYALGVLAYELLTGTTQFDQGRLYDDNGDLRLDETCRIYAQEEPPRPSTRFTMLDAASQAMAATRRQTEPRELTRGICRDLDWIVVKCLERIPTRRYETANGLARDVERYLNNEPISARPQSNLYRLQKTVQRNRLTFAAVAAVVGTLILGVVVSGWQAIRATRAEHQAQAEGAKSRQVADFLKGMLNGLDPSITPVHDTAWLLKTLENNAGRVNADLKTQPEVAVELLNTIGRVYWALGEFVKAEAMHRQALACLQSLHAKDHPEIAATLDSLAYDLYDQDRLVEAEALNRQALAMRRALFGGSHPDIATSLDHLALVLHDLGRHRECESLHREALAMRRAILGNQNVDTASSLSHLGIVLHDQGKLDEAEAMHREALAIRRKVFGSQHPRVASSLDKLASVLRSQHKLTEADSTEREALAVRLKVLGNQHPEVAWSLYHLAQILQSQGKLIEAEAMFHEALEMRRKVLGQEHRHVAYSLDGLARVLLAQSKRAEAEATYREALALWRRLLTPDNPRLANSLCDLATVLRDEGKLAEAESLYREAVAIRQKKFPDAWQTFEVQSRLGEVLLQQTNYAEAGPLLISAYQGIKQREDKIPANSKSRVKEAHQRLVQFCLATGQPEPTAERGTTPAPPNHPQPIPNFPPQASASNKTNTTARAP